uniref:vascular cell adhesion protein 1-like isoform X2 n=1 Tax=Oncorhynchus gorbuscha TaxID=8017 RepID=UPI001EAF867A|nr:vascular cell adhesion protein 1-like isoform X2 [Oncorhynchus gorbuscha]
MHITGAERLILIGGLLQENPSQPTLSPATVHVMEGTSVSLICSAAAPCPSLPPTLTWTPTLSDSVEDLQVTPNRVITSILNFTASHVHHGEKISCTALYKRQAGKSDKSSKTDLTVAVLYSPKNTSVSVSPSDSVVEGSSVTLTCSSNANPAVGRYNWYRVIGEQVSTVRASRMLTVQVPADDSYFYCEAINDHGTEKSSVIQLDGMYPPKNTSLSVSPSGSLVEGSSVTLTCNSNANPAVKNYTWYKINGTEAVLLGSGESFTLDSKASDSGEYCCEALHALGKEKATVVQLDIQSPPKNTSVSVSPSGSVVGGSSLTLTCSSNANPPVKTYTWYRVNESKMVPMESRSPSLVLQDISESGLFCCEAQNSYGKDRSNIFVYFHHCPSTTTAQTSVPSIICGVVFVLWILTVIFGVYKYIRLSRGLKAVGDTYATLQISNVTSTYEVIQRTEYGSREAHRETSGSDM